MTRKEAKRILYKLHDGRADRSHITEAEWDQIDACEDFLARTVDRPKLGVYPACFATANMSEI